MVGRSLSHYLIEARLGAGGMGEVYLARDLALGRMAALKVLAEDVADGCRSRLLQEADVCSRLQHPAIATFYEAGFARDQTYIAMEYVEGETLRSRLARGPLPVEEALALTACVLAGLGHAHALGLLHRDIKPENIMLPEAGGAKLLDFGLAKALLEERSAEGEDARTLLTREGQVVGTAGYMAPEQLCGGDLDTRADLFSVAAVLYEAVAGRAAFPGATPGERLAALLSEDPAPLRGPGIPVGLDELVATTLSREPAARPASARGLLAKLQELQEEGGVEVALPNTLAVLDLENLSGNPDDAWIAQGVAESVGADLARVPGITLLAREKVDQVFKERPADAPADALELGERLGCRWMLTGGFQRMGPALRVTARLLEVPTGRVATAVKIDGRLEGIFELQDQLARRTVEVLQLERPTPSGATGGRDLPAYEHYARGRARWLALGKDALQDAQRHYEQAIALEPRHAGALAGLAGVYAMRYTFTTEAGALDLAEAYARRALEADPRIVEAYNWLTYALLRKDKLQEGEEVSRRAIAVDPSHGMTHYLAACHRSAAGDREAALTAFQRTLELDPRHGWAWLGLGCTHLMQQRREEALWCLEQAVSLERKDVAFPTAGAAGYLAECLRQMGRHAEARAACMEGLQTVEASDFIYRDTFRAFGLCTLGHTLLDEGEREGAAVAFGQAVAHLRGRPRALGGGHLLVQAMAGQAQALCAASAVGEAVPRARAEPPQAAGLFEEARSFFERRPSHDFSWFWGCFDHNSLWALAEAARALGREEEAADLDHEIARRYRQE